MSSDKSNRSPPSSSIPRPNSLLSKSLPSLLSAPADGTGTVEVPPRPRALWKVLDTSLRQIPHFYPKLNPNCSIYVSDASPSVIAVRISECLRKRSISAEYDEEVVTATCLTVDRCQFAVNLYRGNDSDSNDLGIDFSDGVVMECLRISGNTLSFHYACREILQAAAGQSTGEDLRPSFATNGMEFRRIMSSSSSRLLEQLPSLSSQRHGTAVVLELEHVRELLGKDRYECQQAGMERLVAFSCEEVSGTDVCMAVCSEILTSRWFPQYLDSNSTIAPNRNTQSCGTGASVMSACASSFLEVEEKQASTEEANKVPEQIRHEGQLRASAIRVLCNALTFCSKRDILSKFCTGNDSWLNNRDLWRTLVNDLKGTNRPPSVVLTGNRLSSSHEAALALRCLRILGSHIETCKEYVQRDHVLGRLELARACGRSTHLFLQQEAEASYDLFTEDFRSC